MKKNLVCFSLWVVLAVLYYYFLLPPIHFQSIAFWGYVLYLIFWLVVLFAGSRLLVSRRGRQEKLEKVINGVLIGIVAIIFGAFVVNISYSPLFRSGVYRSRIKIKEDGDFGKDIEEVDFSKIPLLDKDSSRKLGDRVMGQMPEMVSQFYVSNLYTQINYQDMIVRVTPLEYNGIFKYFNNHKKGIKGYIQVNSTTGASSLVKLKKGMKYVPSAILGEDLYRHLRFAYPFDVFGTETFEIDEKGQPYWIIPILKYKGIGLLEEISGVVILDPVTGFSKKYDVDDVPKWVDHVYSANLIMAQVDDWGSYQEGFFNSVFGQKNVVMTTDGYNYLAYQDDIYLYTGITSVSSDEANVGFILTNMRTKETVFYPVAGAEEYSAMDSAKGQVQQMKYQSTFPLLINLKGKPTYLISLKDNAGLVKMYAFVDVVDYQKVTVEDASLGIEKVASDFLGGDYVSSSKDFVEENIVVSDIKMAVIDGVSYYYIVDTSGNYYRVSIKVNKNLLPFVKVGDTLRVHYVLKGQITELESVQKNG